MRAVDFLHRVSGSFLLMEMNVLNGKDVENAVTNVVRGIERQQQSELPPPVRDIAPRIAKRAGA